MPRLCDAYKREYSFQFYSLKYPNYNSEPQLTQQKTLTVIILSY